MKTTGIRFAVLAFFLFTGEMRAQNTLSNPGFSTGSFSNWMTFQSNNYIESGNPAPGGNYYCKVYGQFSGVTNFTGIFQDTPSVPGDFYTADGWACSPSADGIKGEDQFWIEVSFRDASLNALACYRSAVVTSNSIAGLGGLGAWFDLPITNQCSFTNAPARILSPGTVTNAVTNLVAQAGTAYVRYQIVFAQGSDNAGGSMYFADPTLNRTGGPASPQWNIVWSDEFNGTAINTNNWTFETGNNNGWGNSELEYYTANLDNAYVTNGLLHIAVLPQSTNGFSYTSARMKTQGLYNTPVYGRFQWRALLPSGTGMWPALWMLGSNLAAVGWPACGEIDVVENNGTPNFVQGSLHYGTSGEISATATNTVTTTNFHTYELDWSATSIQWLVDGVVYETQDSEAPFNAPFFIIMNVAVGGDYTGNPTTNSIDTGTTFPQEMLVDYVRVYEQTAPLQISATQSNGGVVLSWPTNIVCHLQSQADSLANGNWVDSDGTTNPFVAAPAAQTLYYRLESP